MVRMLQPHSQAALVLKLQRGGQEMASLLYLLSQNCNVRMAATSHTWGLAPQNSHGRLE